MTLTAGAATIRGLQANLRRDEASMRVVLNVIWLVFAGVELFLAYVLAGIIACLLIVTIPFGIASFRIAAYAVWPFGRTVVRRPDAGVASAIGNVLWILLFGWWLALADLIIGAILCLTIIGIPLGLGAFKLIPVSLTPLGHEIVPMDSDATLDAGATPPSAQ
jgi:uncharacterized membrane protein YccF (DUF307 family)